MSQQVVVLSGSGLSAESGLPTFRDSAGLWNQYDWRELASPEGWRKHPEVVLAFYNERRARAWAAQPNAAHLAIAALEQKFDVVVITQNVDGLHERAGSTRVLHVHGELAFARGTGHTAALPHRRRAHRARPEMRGGYAAAAGHRVVRRGDAVHGRGREHVAAADKVLVVGTSLSVIRPRDWWNSRGAMRRRCSTRWRWTSCPRVSLPRRARNRRGSESHRTVVAVFAIMGRGRSGSQALKYVITLYSRVRCALPAERYSCASSASRKRPREL